MADAEHPSSDDGWRREVVTLSTPDAGELRFDVAVIGPEAADAVETVVALHGFPQSSRSFAEVGHRLAARGIRVIAPDQRGYSPGARPEGPGAYRDDLLAADVLGLIDHYGVSRAHLLGHDWGAHVAWVLAATHPERVSTLTAVSVPHPTAYAAAFRQSAEQREASAYIKLFWVPGKAEEVLLADGARRLRGMLQVVPADLTDYYVQRMQQPGALTAALSWYRAMRSDGPPTPDVTVPTTYVWSDRDIAISHEAARLCAEHVTGDYTFVRLDGVTHWIPEEAPDELTAAVLDRVRSAP